MSERKWTPGPWHVERGCRGDGSGTSELVEVFVMRSGEDVAVCADVLDPLTAKPSEANARLMAAAPELAEALEECLETLHGLAERHETEGHPDAADLVRIARRSARAALAKAYGRNERE